MTDTTPDRHFTVAKSGEVHELSASEDVSGNCADVGRHLMRWDVDEATPRYGTTVRVDIFGRRAPDLDCSSGVELDCTVSKSMADGVGEVRIVPTTQVKVPLKLEGLPESMLASVSAYTDCLENITPGFQAPQGTSDHVLSAKYVTRDPACANKVDRSITWQLGLHGPAEANALIQASVSDRTHEVTVVSCTLGEGQRYRCEVQNGRGSVRIYYNP
jgi:hypothetical protein